MSDTNTPESTPATDLEVRLADAMEALGKLETNNRKLTDQLKRAQSTPKALRELLDGGEVPEGANVHPDILEKFSAMREQSAAAAAASEKYAAKLKAEQAERAKLAEQYQKAQGKLDRIDLERTIKKAAPDRFQDDLFDVAVDKLSPFLGRSEDGGFVPMKDGQPWKTEDGKDVSLSMLIEDMSPSGDHTLTGIDVPSLFRPVDGNLPSPKDRRQGNQLPRPAPIAGRLGSGHARIAELTGRSH